MKARPYRRLISRGQQLSPEIKIQFCDYLSGVPILIEIGASLGFYYCFLGLGSERNFWGVKPLGAVLGRECCVYVVPQKYLSVLNIF